MTTVTQIKMAQPKEERLVLLVLFISLFVGVADFQIIGPFLPLLGKAFSRSAGEMGIAVTVYSVAAAIAALLAGFASDIHGRTIFLKGAMALFVATTLATSLVTTAPMFILLRAATGVAAGVISSAVISYVADYFPYRTRGRAMGIIMASYFAAATLGVVGLSLVADRLAWFYSYRILAGLGLGAFVLLVTLLPEIARESPADSISRRSSLLKLFEPAALAAFSMAFMVSGGMVTYLTYIGAFLNQAFRRTTSDIGVLFLLGGFSAVISAPLAGRLADRVGKRWLIIIGNLLLATSFLLLPSLQWGWPIVSMFGMASLAAGLRQGPFEAFTTSVVSAQRRGAFIALRNLSSQMGIALSALAGSALYTYGGGFRAVALLCAGLTVASCLPALIIKEPVKDGS